MNNTSPSNCPRCGASLDDSRVDGLCPRCLGSQNSCWFTILCCFIAAVSVHDAYLLLHNRQMMLEFEKNPIGRWLIEVDEGDVTLFVAVKLTTTAAVCSFLIWMYRRYPRWTKYIATGVATFQFGLLLYLMGAK